MKYAYKKLGYRILVPMLDFIGYVVFFPLRFLGGKPPVSPKSILVVRLDHIGDFICTTPLFKNIKTRFPGSKITVLLNSASKDLAYRDPHIDKVITFSPFYLSRAEKTSSFKGLARVVKDVRSIGFDLGIDPRGDLLSIVIMWLGEVKYRVGYGITGGGFLLSKECRYDKGLHVIDRNLKLIEEMGGSVEDKMPEVHFSNEDKEIVEKLLQEIKMDENGIAGKGRWVVLHPFAGARSKEWPICNFQSLIDRLKDEGRAVLLVGSKNDRGVFENTTDLKGRVTLPQLACLIKAAGMFIGLDSGPANIAAALNVPSVIICSGTNVPQLWIPAGSNVRFVYKDTGCKPCGDNACPKEKHECMDGISVDEVITAVKGLGQ